MTIARSVQNAPERVEYDLVLTELKQILEDLPPKIIAIDGNAGVVKSTLGRFLAWRFNITLLETDLYILGDNVPLNYRYDELKNVIDARLKRGRPIVVEGIVCLEMLQQLKLSHDYHIHVTCDEADTDTNLQEMYEDYVQSFQPADCSDLQLNLPALSE